MNIESVDFIKLKADIEEVLQNYAGAKGFNAVRNNGSINNILNNHGIYDWDDIAEVLDIEQFY